jgi:3-hydroxy-9,10-secoandrosta-1,3,5(10)-triene-9,17-dione monooxygenase reductase component
MSLASLHIEADRPDPQRFRSAMGTFATGVAVVTTELAGAYHGMTVNSLTSVSLAPCMLLICPRRGSATGDAIRARGEFAVNILGAEQQHLSARFVSADIVDRFIDIDLQRTARGIPLLTGAIAHLCCRVSAIHPGGDHEIVVGEVLTSSESTGFPLLFHKGRYGGFHSNA